MIKCLICGNEVQVMNQVDFTSDQGPAVCQDCGMSDDSEIIAKVEKICVDYYNDSDDIFTTDCEKDTIPLLEQVQAKINLLPEKGQLQDGYHTFDELYEQRKAYNAALFNEQSEQGKYKVHKTKRLYSSEQENLHEMMDGWFIVFAVLPNGQISNYYPISDWDLFCIPETEKALFPFDGHTAKDVIERLKSLQLWNYNRKS